MPDLNLNESDETEAAFTDTVDPYQARNGRREALQYAIALKPEDAEELIEWADQIDAYLEDGSIPD